MEKTEKRNQGLTLVSVVAGGIAGWTVNVGLSIFNNTDTTH
ncbi:MULTISPECIES: hypothetical protein [Oceanobacillus]|uniref:Uncharacterized protein n=2 Tax=Oceanobacillus kimchii TaxID=746691 RepID=A0ABQ5TCY4_9BACI|nr:MULTISPECIES: hypothetical protein [Oceanobacillus]GLO64476.1 hypothetical protein MACH08_02600 [Oceanobacillus kimchii]